MYVALAPRPLRPQTRTSSMFGPRSPGRSIARSDSVRHVGGTDCPPNPRLEIPFHKFNVFLRPLDRKAWQHRSASSVLQLRGGNRDGSALRLVVVVWADLCTAHSSCPPPLVSLFPAPWRQLCRFSSPPLVWEARCVAVSQPRPRPRHVGRKKNKNARRGSICSTLIPHDFDIDSPLIRHYLDTNPARIRHQFDTGSTISMLLRH